MDKKCGNCLAPFGKCSKCREKYPHGTVVKCAKPACSGAAVECQCGLLISTEMTGVMDMDGNLVPWSLTNTF